MLQALLLTADKTHNFCRLSGIYVSAEGVPLVDLKRGTLQYSTFSTQSLYHSENIQVTAEFRFECDQ